MTNFVTVDSIYGYFILNRHDRYQYLPLKNKKVPHINNEIEKILQILSDLGDNLIILDGGSNIGLITIPVAKKIKCEVHSFEPQKQIFYCLCGNVVINNLNNVTTYNQGLGDKNKTMFVPYIDYDKGRDFGDVELNYENGDPIEIATIDYLNFEKLDFIKLDIESMEIEALRGGRETIKKFRPWCWIEYIKSNINDLTEFFKELNYNVYIVDEANIVAVPNDVIYSWMKEKL